MGWVTERHRCTLHHAFAELIETAEADVSEANRLLPPDQREARPFHLDRGNNGHKRFVVTGSPIKSDTYSDKYTFIFELHAAEDQIHIRRNGPDTLINLDDLMITQRWDTDTSSCILCMGGRKVTIAQISQIVLEPMFFGA